MALTGAPSSLTRGCKTCLTVRVVAKGSRAAIEWLQRTGGVLFTLSLNGQTYEVDGYHKSWGGMALIAVHCSTL